ncbi:AAA family ATPase [Rugamonas sp. FT82W]|uniref:AAA family ATPase n=2 Tax=Duganella vulcania TaxID=2692166 RepID=A0A845G1G9_9BURK|nr:AAA family ATPase [Duganella vulcania]
MIRSVQFSNFKSLVDLYFRLPKFAVLVGMNGAGKTTILQALDFLAQTMKGDIDDWLDARNWTAADLGSKLTSSSNISMAAEVGGSDCSAPVLAWSATFNRKELACLSELGFVPGGGNHFYNVKGRRYKINGQDTQPVAFSYQGSLLSQLRENELTPMTRQLRDALRSIHSLELLSPHLMRQRSRGSAGGVGAGGERLSAFLYSIKGEEKAALIDLLKTFYPHVVDFRSAPTKGGWKRLSIVENYNGKNIESEVRHINDGLLRILAMLAQTMAGQSTLLFDEVENGVNPEIVGKLVNLLANADQQIVVTTHSPMILNYLADEVARESVLFVYKTPDGYTRVKPFFEAPGMSEKLAVMGAGEAFVDTDLALLTAKCIALESGASAMAVA